MALATDRWILINIRETWSYFTWTIKPGDVTDPAFDGWFSTIEDDTEVSFRSPIAYLDRVNSFVNETRLSCGADTFATPQNATEGAAVGIQSWAPAKPPGAPGSNGGTPTENGVWEEVKMVDNVFEHDPFNNNGVVTLTQSLLYTCRYVELRYSDSGAWLPASSDLIDFLWADAIPSS